MIGEVSDVPSEGATGSVIYIRVFPPPHKWAGERACTDPARGDRAGKQEQEERRSHLKVIFQIERMAAPSTPVKELPKEMLIGDTLKG